MVAVIILILLLVIELTYSFSSELTRGYCNTPLDSGTIMMGEEVVKSSQYSIRVIRYNDEELISNESFFNPNGETLRVALNKLVFQVVFEVSKGAKFINGSCASEIRTNIYRNASLVIPPSHDENIVIKAVWAHSYGTVFLTEDFILKKKFESDMDL